MTAAEFDPLVVSLGLAAGAIAAALPAAFLLGWALTLRFPGRGLAEAAVLALLVMPGITVGYGLVRLGDPGPLLDGVAPAWAQAGAWPLAALSLVSLPFLVYGARAAFAAAGRPSALAALTAGVALALARAVGDLGATLVFVAHGHAGWRTLPAALAITLQAPDGEAHAARLALLSAGIALAAGCVAAAFARLGGARDAAARPARPAVASAPAPGLVLSGTLREHQLVDGLSRIETGCGALWVPRLPLTVGSAVDVRIAAADVLLVPPPAAAGSAIGVLEIEVRSVAPRGPTAIDVVIDPGPSAQGGVMTLRLTSRAGRLLGAEAGRRLALLIRDASVAPAVPTEPSA